MAALALSRRKTSAAFLEIITRHMVGRADLLAKNQESIEAQTVKDWQHTILVDGIGKGMAWAQMQLADFIPIGEYVWILDDDDRCIRPTLVAELQEIAREHDPDVIMLRMDHKERGIQPANGLWGQAPVIGHIGCSAYVVRNSTWQKHAAIWREGTYYNDFLFIEGIFRDTICVYWHDVIASEVMRISYGQPEAEGV